MPVMQINEFSEGQDYQELPSPETRKKIGKSESLQLKTEENQLNSFEKHQTEKNKTEAESVQIIAESNSNEVSKQKPRHSENDDQYLSPKNFPEDGYIRCESGGMPQLEKLASSKSSVGGVTCAKGQVPSLIQMSQYDS